MPHHLSRRLLGWLLLPLVLMMGGAGFGVWRCADGDPCESAAALACCCGEAVGCAPAHECRDAHESRHVSAGPCGCYYTTPVVDLQVKSEPGADLVTALAPALTLFPAPPKRGAFVFAPMDAGRLPWVLISPRRGRAPPLV